MTREDFLTLWRTRQSEWARIGALVDGARVCEDVLQDFEAVTLASKNASLLLYATILGVAGRPHAHAHDALIQGEGFFL